MDEGVINDKLETNMYEIRLNESGIVWRRHAYKLLSITSDDIETNCDSHEGSKLRRSSRVSKLPDRLT